MNENFITVDRLRGVKFSRRPRLSDEAFAEGCLVYVRFCVDVFFINREGGIIYLAYRIIPTRGWMGFGGAVDPGEDIEDACSRIIQQDTGLQVPSKKLCFLRQYRLMYLAYGDPRDAFALQFFCEVKSEQVTSIKLNIEEYDVEQGVRSFNRAQLTQEQSSLHPGVMSAFDRIFS